MEQEELELIKRLQNTQIMQKTAYDDLENALNGSFNQEQLAQQVDGRTPMKSSLGNSAGRPMTSQSSSGAKFNR
jgi:hypothetical protein